MYTSYMLTLPTMYVATSDDTVSTNDIISKLYH